MESVLSAEGTATALFAAPPGIKSSNLEKSQKIKYDINKLDRVIVHNNSFDASFVEYF
jgi:hypothetical protein